LGRLRKTVRAHFDHDFKKRGENPAREWTPRGAVNVLAVLAHRGLAEAREAVGDLLVRGTRCARGR
jgi:hypothetical protein